MPEPRLTDTDRAAVSAAVKHAKLIEASRKMARIVRTVHPTPEALRRRKRYEASLVKWLPHYMPDTFPDRWGRVHIECCERLQECLVHGGSFAFAMPRGGGKSAIGKGAAVYATLLGLRRYVVSIGATDSLALEYVEFAKSQLDGSNERIAQDYPEVVTFFRALDGKAIKARFQLREDGQKTGIEWCANRITYPTILDRDGKPYPFSGARLECRGITAAMKGMSRTVGGVIIRPDFVLPDDVQTEDDALSEAACAKIEAKIVGTVLALAGPRKRIACFMPTTVVRMGDVACRFLDREAHPEFQGVRIPMVVRWPDAQQTLWAEYERLRLDADTDRQGKAAATAFYRRNRAAMDAGAEVSWEARVRAGEISALETAENLLIEMGEEKFFAEMQQEPRSEGARVAELRPEDMKADASRRPGAVPAWATLLVAATDVNPVKIGLTSAIYAFGPDQRAAVVWYGLHRFKCGANDTPTQVKARVMQELEAHGRGHIADLLRRCSLWMIDGAGSPQGTVTTFAAHSQRTVGVRALACFGRASRVYRATAGGKKIREYEQCHVVTESFGNQWAIFNADYWRETMQRAWRAAAGAPGSIDLPAGDHREFRDQHCREQLAGRAEVGGRVVYVWDTAPGDHDYSDCSTMAFAGAAICGIGTGGATVRARPNRVPRRKCSVPMEVT